MPKGRMKAADKAILADLLARYPKSVIARQLGKMRKAGRPKYPLLEKYGSRLAGWALIERKRDGADLSVAKAAKIVSEECAKFFPDRRYISASLLEKAHREIERAMQDGFGAGVENLRQVMLDAALG
jgi:hypothetical protein